MPYYLRLVPIRNLTFLGVEAVVDAVAGGEGKGDGEGVDPLVVGDGLESLPSLTSFKLRWPAFKCIPGWVTATALHSFPADTSPFSQ